MRDQQFSCGQFRLPCLGVRFPQDTRIFKCVLSSSQISFQNHTRCGWMPWNSCPWKVTRPGMSNQTPERKDMRHDSQSPRLSKETWTRISYHIISQYIHCFKTMNQLNLVDTVYRQHMSRWYCHPFGQSATTAGFVASTFATLGQLRGATYRVLLQAGWIKPLGPNHRSKWAM